jgi:signal transduction histidine kinase/ligand-binding sensor domain-containing protein
MRPQFLGSLRDCVVRTCSAPAGRKGSGAGRGPTKAGWVRRIGGFVAAIAVLLATAPALHAAVPYTLKTADPLLDAWRWQKLVEFDGKEPRSMVEGADGAMWFGSGDGVVRYDGLQWRYFLAADGLAGTRVGVLRRAKDGTIYAGTEVGIFRFQKERWEKVFPADAATKLPITALICAADGAIWASSGNFLFRLKDGNGTLFAGSAMTEAESRIFSGMKTVVVPSVIPMTTAVKSLLEDRTGLMWCGLYSGELVRFDPRAPDLSVAEAWRFFTAQDGFRKSRFDYSLCEARDGKIWVGGDLHDVGLNCYNPVDNTWTYIDLPAIFGTDGIARSIIQTSDGAIWVGGLARLFRFLDGEWRLYRAPEAPVSASRTELLESRNGELWLLGLGDDVQRVDAQGRRWLKYEGLNFECETPDGRQWFLAADEGVVCFDGKQWSRFGVADGLMASPYALLCTSKGELWAAGTHEDKAMIARFDGSRWIGAGPNRGIFAFTSIIDSRALTEALDGSLWFGAYVNGRGTGLLQYDPAKGPPEAERAWTVHTGVGYTFSYGFAVAKNGALFSGTYGGLARYAGGKWERLDPKPIDAITQSRDGEVWVGTRGTGVYRYDEKNPVAYTMKEGLRASGITAMFFDRDNHLWAGTNKGVSRFDGTEWVTDVFPGERFAIAREGGGFRQSSDGALWLNQSSREWMRRALPGGKLSAATIKAFWTVRYHRETEAPRTEILAALKRVSQPGNTAISWRGIDPWWRTAESELRYSYRIDGGAWSKFGPETNHVFLELPTGAHTFEVRARDRDLNVEATPARVEFTVVPPVWRQPWFLGLMGLLTAAIAMQTYRVVRRDQRLRASNQRLSAEIQERTKAESRLTEKTSQLEDEVEERRAVQTELEERKISLEKEIDERKRMEREIEKIHRELMQASHQAGMAEVATSVLHNIGNALNSINVSATLAEEKLKQFRVANLAKAAELLEAHAAEPNFLTTDAKGKLVPGFLKNLSEDWASLLAGSGTELKSLRQNIEHVKEIVATQQEYARFSGLIETVKVSEMVEDALRMNADALHRHVVELVRDYQADGLIEIEKSKLLQILVNFIQNAKQACAESARPDKRIVLRLRQPAPGKIQIEVIDNGVGIPAENMTRIFNHGFTTRKTGHGFGLHSSANAAKAIGANLTVRSDGEGQGATFALELTLVVDTPQTGALRSPA